MLKELNEKVRKGEMSQLQAFREFFKRFNDSVYGTKDGKFRPLDPNCEHEFQSKGSWRTGTSGRGGRIAHFTEVLQCKKCKGHKWGNTHTRGLMPGEF